MSQYNGPLVAAMRAIGPTASAKTNDALYVGIITHPEAITKILDARERHEPVPKGVITPAVEVVLSTMQKMIESNMSFVISKVESYISVYPDVEYLRDDMVGEGLLGVTVAVNRMAKEGPREKPNPTGYISYWIMKMIGEIVEREGAGGVASASTAMRKRKSGDNIPKSRPLPSNFSESQVVDPTAMIELRDLIEACCETEEDKIIVEMREARHTDAAIAQRLNLPLTTVYMMRREIYARFLEKSGLQGEV